jgi:hypothetical protein
MQPFPDRRRLLDVPIRAQPLVGPNGEKRETIMSKTRLGVVATAAALTLGLAAPASAASIGVKDPADIGHGVDLRAVHVVNGEKNLRIVLNHTNLRRDPRTGASGVVYIDTDAGDRGPELVFAGGYFEGTDYQLLKTEGFGPKQWKAPVSGFYKMTLDYAEEQTRMRISRQALGDVDSVRVSVKVAGQRTDGSAVVDWLGERRSFTTWVHRG